MFPDLAANTVAALGLRNMSDFPTIASYQTGDTIKSEPSSLHAMSSNPYDPSAISNGAGHRQSNLHPIVWMAPRTVRCPVFWGFFGKDDKHI